MIAVDDVCTHADLAAECGGAEELENLLPTSWDGSSQVAREKALQDVLRALARRTPPIREGDLQRVDELRDAVAFGALERVYRAAMTGPDSPHAELRKLYERRFNAEVLGLSPTLAVDGGRGTAFSIAVERR